MSTNISNLQRLFKALKDGPLRNAVADAMYLAHMEDGMDPDAAWGVPDVTAYLSALDNGYDPDLMQDVVMQHPDNVGRDSEIDPYDAFDIVSNGNSLFKTNLLKGPPSSQFASPLVDSQAYLRDLANTTYNPTDWNNAERLNELADTFGQFSQARPRTPLRILLGELPNTLPDSVPSGYQSPRLPTGDASEYPAAQSADVLLEALYGDTRDAYAASPYEAAASSAPDYRTPLDRAYARARKAYRQGFTEDAYWERVLDDSDD